MALQQACPQSSQHIVQLSVRGLTLHWPKLSQLFLSLTSTFICASSHEH